MDAYWFEIPKNRHDIPEMSRAVTAAIMQAGQIAETLNRGNHGEEYLVDPVLEAGIVALHRMGREDLIPGLIEILDSRRLSICALWDAESIV